MGQCMSEYWLKETLMTIPECQHYFIVEWHSLIYISPILFFLSIHGAVYINIVTTYKLYFTFLVLFEPLFVE